MKKNGYIQSLINAIKDPERDLIERIYLALTIISELTVFIALIGDILTKENPYEIAIIIGTLIFVPSLMAICLKKNKIKTATKITVIGLVFVILPSLYFFGGGVEGGGVLWIIFTFTYAGLVLTGAWRTVIFGLIVLMSFFCYVMEYYHPEMVYEHTKREFFIDSFISIVLVGIVCFAMTWLQNWIFQMENERAQKAAKQAEDLTKSQNRFFSSMSHEIRTPINSILGLNELILRDQSASDEIVRDAVGIQGSGKMLLALINDILDFSKIEAGSMDIVPVDYNIGDMLSEIVNMIWVKANDKGLKLNVSIDPKVPALLYGDEVRVKQIILNLLNNAVKYTGAGYVELHIESSEKNEKTVELTISISDTGMGIKREVIPFLFDAFKRVDEEKNRYIEGTGLGLSIVKQLVDLMGGTITVNSVYGEGSTFTVVLDQGISDDAQIGELNIHNQSVIHRSKYECGFRAPEARILIVDDNLMNLEVEARLLADTDMVIDQAISGKEALEYDLKYRYDVILMDHLMPEMDGIKCLEEIRNHTGGLNHTTPVLILTANAGSDNKELYNRAGFDGYLVKPVSGEALENLLVKYISKEKIILNNNKVMTMREDIKASDVYSGKAAVIITSTSMCDLPNTLVKKLRIPIIPFYIKTEEGVFKDGIQMGADELIRYINKGKNAESAPPEEQDYTEFFAAQLKKAHHIIHIALTTDMSADYKRATEVAKSFDNVTVVNSELISSAAGILVLIAYKLSQMYDSVEEIVQELEYVKHYLKCSFVIDTTEYMARRDLVNRRVHSVAKSLSLHPSIVVRDNKTRTGTVWMGSTKRAYRKYIQSLFTVDPDVAFITYVDVPQDTLMWIKKEIEKYAHFENIVFKQASAAISSNCGPGTFGVLFMVKNDASYNLSSLFDNSMLIPDNNAENVSEADTETTEITDYEEEEILQESDKNGDNEKTEKWYENLEGIDGEAAMKNSGSESAFKSVLKIFYESIEGYSGELQGFYDENDWGSYTIKVHALKSSCKLIGALGTAKKAELLESAGKEDNIDYIKSAHDDFMTEYLGYKGILDKVFGNETAAAAPEKKPAKPEMGKVILDSVFEGIREAAEAMDYSAIEEILDEVDNYEIPDNEADRFRLIREKFGQFDYDGILDALK